MDTSLFHKASQLNILFLVLYIEICKVHAGVVDFDIAVRAKKTKYDVLLVFSAKTTYLNDDPVPINMVFLNIKSSTHGRACTRKTIYFAWPKVDTWLSPNGIVAHACKLTLMQGTFGVSLR